MIFREVQRQDATLTQSNLCSTLPVASCVSYAQDVVVVKAARHRNVIAHEDVIAALEVFDNAINLCHD